MKNAKFRIRKTPYNTRNRGTLVKKLSRLNQEDIPALYGVKYIAGIDEVGVGAVAGPATFALCVFPVDFRMDVKDSKRYASKKDPEAARAALVPAIEHSASFHMTIDASAREFNEHGHTKACNAAVVSLLKAIPPRYSKHDILIVLDGDKLPQDLPANLRSYNIVAVPKADDNITAVSAASVLAKVSRDAYMTELSQQPYYERYEFDKNKGYLTPPHREAILSHGLSSNHRNVRYSFLSDEQNKFLCTKK